MGDFSSPGTSPAVGHRTSVQKHEQLGDLVLGWSPVESAWPLVLSCPLLQALVWQFLGWVVSCFGCVILELVGFVFSSPTPKQ